MKISEFINPAADHSKLPTSVTGAKLPQKQNTAAPQTKRGQKVNLPTGNSSSEFEVDTVTTADVTVKPVKRTPGSPEKITFKKKEFDAISQGTK